MWAKLAIRKRNEVKVDRSTEYQWERNYEGNYRIFTNRGFFNTTEINFFRRKAEEAGYELSGIAYGNDEIGKQKLYMVFSEIH